MSNTINVGGKYYPFRWAGKQLQAYMSEQWVNVQDSGKRTRREIVFETI